MIKPSYTITEIDSICMQICKDGDNNTMDVLISTVKEERKLYTLPHLAHIEYVTNIVKQILCDQ